MKTLRYLPSDGHTDVPHFITVGDDVAASLLVNDQFTLADDPPPDDTGSDASPDAAPDASPVPDELPDPPTPEQIALES